MLGLGCKVGLRSRYMHAHCTYSIQYADYNNNLTELIESNL